MKLLREKYKTSEGARKRARFENGLAPGEFARGGRLFTYHIVQHDGLWRVARYTPDELTYKGEE